MACVYQEQIVIMMCKHTNPILLMYCTERAGWRPQKGRAKTLRGMAWRPLRGWGRPREGGVDRDLERLNPRLHPSTEQRALSSGRRRYSKEGRGKGGGGRREKVGKAEGRQSGDVDSGERAGPVRRVTCMCLRCVGRPAPGSSGPS